MVSARVDYVDGVSIFFWFFGDMFFRPGSPVLGKPPKKQLSHWKEQAQFYGIAALLLPFLLPFFWSWRTPAMGIFCFIVLEIRCVLIWQHARLRLKELEIAPDVKLD